MIRRPTVHHDRWRGLPRTRGDDPDIGDIGNVFFQFAPHARG